MQGREWGIIVVQDLSYSRWANELFLHSETLFYRDLFLAEDITANIFGYTIGRPALDIGMSECHPKTLRRNAYLGCGPPAAAGFGQPLSLSLSLSLRGGGGPRMRRPADAAARG